MKKFILLISFLLLGLWSYFLLVSVGVASHFGVLEGFALPQSIAELGDSLGVVNGLLTAVSVVLAWVAILIQGRELKEATKAQNEQARILGEQMRLLNESTTAQCRQAQALSEQMELQKQSLDWQAYLIKQTLSLQAYSIRQVNLVHEISEMDRILESISGDYSKKDLWDNAVKKKNRLKDELKKIESILGELTVELLKIDETH